MKYKNKKYFPLLISIIIGGLLISLSLLLFTIFRNVVINQSQERLESSFEIESQEILNTTENILKEYSDVLIGARALFDASESVERDEWRNFFNSLEIGKNFPALTALEYVRKVEKDNLQDFTEFVRSDDSVESGGYPDFEVNTNNLQEEYYIVEYIEPFEANYEVFGFDLYSNLERRKAINLARDTNSIVITEPVRFLQNGKLAFLVMIPLYESEADLTSLDKRRDANYGMIVAAVIDDNLFSQVVLSSSLNNLDDFSVTDITDKSLPVITSNKNLPTVLTTQIVVGTRIWKFDFHSDEQLTFTNVELLAPSFLLITGIIISFLVSLIIYNSQRLQFKAQKLADKLTEDIAKFKLAVESASEHIIITDLSGNIIYANPAATKITGYSQKEIIGQKPSLWGKQMPKEYYQKMWDIIKNKKKVYTGEIINKKKSGELYYALTSIAPVLDENNNVNYFVGIERDITREKNLEEYKDQRSENMLENIAEGVIVTNENSEISFVNEAFYKMTGFGPKQLMNKDINEVLAILDLNEKRADIANSGKGDYLLACSENKKLAVSISSSTINVGGTLRGAVHVFHDFTQEYEIKKEKDEFFSIASHELRTPLTVISGNIDMILNTKEKTNKNSDEIEMLEDSREASDRLIKIVNDFLSVSKIDQGEVNFDIEDVDPFKILSETVDTVNPLAENKKIKIVNELNKSNGTVKADAEALNRVFTNVISNAIKFTDEGSITISLDEDDSYYYFKFIDTGIGIDKKYQKYLFKRFQQAMGSRLAREKEGTGLGLYISKKSMQMIGGDVYLEKSIVGQGSTFIVKIKKE